jgi:sterol desaturase/sphingolipid hydroxylase (fatty acid hydroxylase superfamily)
MKYLDADYLQFIFLSAIFILLAAFEFTRPRRKPGHPRPGRWFTNCALTFINFFMVRVALGGAAFAAAEYASQRGWGFLNDLEASWPLEFAIGFVFLDLMIYLQHVLTHALPFLWRLHIVHHSDLDVDATTAMRFHPGEVLISMFFRIGVVAAMGIHSWTVLIYELAYNTALLFIHSNVKLSHAADANIRNVIITPDFHRVHHSAEPEETNSNFGFLFSWWDRLFGTYRPRPVMPHNLMQLGVSEYRRPEELGLYSLLAMPIRARMGAYSFKHEK